MKLKNSKIRFIIVGIANTLIDFSILIILGAMGIHIGISNIISTSTAFVCSYVANKRFTFKTSSQAPHREIIRFIAVTLFGLWVIQTIIILLTMPILHAIIKQEGYALVVAKVLATCATLVWNYTLYSRLVFVHKNSHSDETRTI